MSKDTLTAISPLDGRYASQVEDLALYFSEYGLIKYRVNVELYWLKHLSQIAKIVEVPVLSIPLQQQFEELIEHFSKADAQQVKDIEKSTNHDVKAVEYWLKEKFKDNAEIDKIKEFFHFACTSEDINNLSYALMLRDANQKVIVPKLQQLIGQLRDFAHRYASVPMMARTHGQAATPTTIGKEIANTVFRLDKQLKKLKQHSFMAKINGAVGNFNAHYVVYPEVDWFQENQVFIESLGLQMNPYTIQIEPHDSYVEYFQILLLINIILIDFNRDVWGYISLNYFKQKLRENEVGSSTMPHKVNPIDFENSEGNLGLANVLLDHLIQKLPISRWQRDLTDSTVLRNIGVALGYGILAYNSLLKGLNKLEVNEDIILQDLSSRWELLAEPIQTVMRRYGVEAPYEKLKALTRGKNGMTASEIQAFIENLDIPAEAKVELLKLKPENYLGIAERLAKAI